MPKNIFASPMHLKARLEGSMKVINTVNLLLCDKNVVAIDTQIVNY